MVERPATTDVVMAIHVLQHHTVVRPEIVLKPGILVRPGNFPIPHQYGTDNQTLPHSRVKVILQIVTEHERRATPQRSLQYLILQMRSIQQCLGTNVRLRLRVLQHYISSVILKKPNIGRGERRVLDVALRRRRACQRTDLIYQRELVEAAVPCVAAETAEAEDDNVPDRPAQRRERRLDGVQERGPSELGALRGEGALCGRCPGRVVARGVRDLYRDEVAGRVPQWGSPFADDVAPAICGGDDVAA